MHAQGSQNLQAPQNFTALEDHFINTKKENKDTPKGFSTSFYIVLLFFFVLGSLFLLMQIYLILKKTDTQKIEEKIKDQSLILKETP